MEPKHRTILLYYWSNIRENLEPKNILPKLVKVLIETDYDEIREQSTRQDRCDKLLEILPRRGPIAFEVFVEALDKEVPHLASVLNKAEKERQDQEVAQPQRKNKELEDRVTKQTPNFECEKRKTKKEAKDYSEQPEAETKAQTDLQVKVDELKDKLENQRMQMSERFSEAINAERSKSDRLEKEVNRLKLRLRETIRPGRIYRYSGKDFDKRGVVYALVKKFGRTNSSGTGVIATRSSDERGTAEIILENQLQRGVVCATKAKENSWWRVDLTESYALYLTHYTLRHGQEQSGSFLCNWRLEGSVDGCNWAMLKNHNNDQGLRGPKRHYRYYSCTWTIDGELNAFRYFRIFQTGLNSSYRFGIFLSGMELYGVLVEIGS